MRAACPETLDLLIVDIASAEGHLTEIALIAKTVSVPLLLLMSDAEQEQLHPKPEFEFDR